MILQALTDYYRVLEQAGKIDAPGWAPVKVSYALLLSENGTLEQVIDAIEQRLATGTLSPVNLTVSNQNMGETFGTEVDV